MPQLFLAFVLSLVLSFWCDTTSAMAPFKKAFDQRYVKESGNEQFQATFKKTGCNTCHVKGKKKDVLNAYGLELAKLIEGRAKDRLSDAKKKGSDAKKDEQKKLLQELEEALKKAESLKSSSGKSYHELFTAHELPSPDGAKSIGTNSDK